MHWVGLDLHKRYITTCAMDEQGGIVAEHRRLPADDTTLLGWLSALPGPVTVVMEATLYWAWLHDRLTTAGGVRRIGAQHAELRGQDDARGGRQRGEPVAEMDPDRDRADAETGAGPDRHAISEAATVEGEGQSDRSSF
jgi:hypothetical protein